jgi:hypothetical protein
MSGRSPAAGGRPGRATGPRTARGKARSARNAVKHGLNIALRDDPQVAAELAAWRRAFAAGGADDPELLTRLAECQVQLLRIRRARCATLARAAARRPAAAGPLPDAAAGRPPAAAGEPALADVVLACADELLTLDGYERKALSRRNRLLRALGPLRPG